ncbi:MFS transporter [Amycolatopsis thermophila]|uniref:MFS transporter n=1 Tax=Amycolatopsis thermophila TaxID=206084 RepID=UPI0027D888E8|nr:MFS transporter [Amycolatopsis thermophila]
MSPLSDESTGVPRTTLSRVAVASCAGTTIEFYDFFIYGTAAALVFPKVFFPALGAAAGTVASLATLGVAFVARPVGAVVCGHFGDRLGRKNTLVVTLLLMGLATVVIGLLPPASVIGAAGPILLTVLRFLQGFAVGGEWAGATLLAAENAPPGKRGLYAVFPQLGPAFGFALASGTFFVIDLAVGPDSPAFLSYGWRIPFVASAILVLIGLYVRLAVTETAEFREHQAKLRSAGPQGAGGLPLRAVLRAQWREVLLGGGVLTILFALFYVATAYRTSFGTSRSGAGLSRAAVLGLGMAASAALAITTVAAGILSDRFGRRRTIIFAYAVTVPAVVLLFAWLTGRSGAAFGVTLAAMMGLYGIAYGPVGAFLPELFRTAYRYTGAGIAYNLGGVLGGAIAPLVAAALAASYGVLAVGVLLGVLGVVSLLSTVALRTRAARDRSPAAAPELEHTP